MKFIEKFKCPLAVVVVWFLSALCARTSVAQLVVTATDDAAFLGQSLFPSSIGDPFQFNNAALDFGFDDSFGKGELGRSIGTFTNNTSVYGIGDPGNTVAAGIAISSGVVENYSSGPNFSGSTSGFLDTTASDEQVSLLSGLSPAAGGVFRDLSLIHI